MPSTLSLGQFEVVGGRNILSGVSSHVDTGTIIKGMTSAETKDIADIKDSITINNKKSSAYNTLSSLLDIFESTTKLLRYTPGINNEDIFASRNIFGTTNTGASAGNYVSITAQDNAELGSFTLNVQQLAQAKIQQSWAFSSKTTSVVASTATSGQFTAGTFQLNGINITLTAGNNLTQVASTINAQSSATNTTAKIVQPSVGQYRLLLQSTLTGIANAFTITDTSNVLNNLFSTDATYNPSPTVQSAQDATLLYDGNIIVTRPTNTIDDFIDDMVFILNSKNNPSDVIEVEISPNDTLIHDTIKEFVDNYNAISQFIQQQSSLASEEPSDDETDDEKTTRLANLKRDPIIKAIGYSIDNYISQPIPGISSYNNLTSIGITYADTTSTYNNKPIIYKNQLAIDDTTLTTAIADNFDDVRKLFQMNFVATSTNLALGEQRGNNLNVNSLQFDININRTTTDTNGNTIKDIVHVIYTPPSGSATTIKADFTPSDSSDYTKGGRISGQTGTILENFNFQYTGTGVEVINVNVTQGIADKIYNYLSEIDSDGVINSAQQILTDLENKYNNDLDKKNAEIEDKREYLLEKYGKLEATYSKANNMLMFLEAQQNSWNK